MTKRNGTRPRKRVPRKLTPVVTTSIALPRRVRELFADYARENDLTLSHAIVLYIIDTLDGNKGIISER